MVERGRFFNLWYKHYKSFDLALYYSPSPKTLLDKFNCPLSNNLPILSVEYAWKSIWAWAFQKVRSPYYLLNLIFIRDSNEILIFRITT